MSESELILQISDLHVEYKTDDGVMYAVNGADLQIKKGKTLGLVGETGAGKTTTALSVMGLLPDKVGHVTKGSILYKGDELLKKSDAEMRKMRGSQFSMIFQDPMTSLNPLHTVGKQIGEVLELHQESLSQQEIEEKVDEMLEMVGIPATRKDEFPHQFSGGMKQRIVIAIALACNPELLLADEPTTALDVTIQAQVLKMMNNLKEKLNTAMLLITHDMGVVAQVCDDVAIMYAGEIIEYGTAEDIFEAELRHPYTVGLFNSIPDIDSTCKRLKPIDGLMPDPSHKIEGCRFAQRCEHCMDICKTLAPPVVNMSGHQVKCHLYAQRQCNSES